MNAYITPVDITNIPAMRRIIKEMKSTKQPRLLKQDSETVAMLMPMGTALKGNMQALWTGYHPDKVHQVLPQSTVTLAGVNRKKLLEDTANART